MSKTNSVLGPYKRYSGTVEHDFESGVLYGRLVGVKDVVTYEGTTLSELEQAFRDSIDDYLAFCETEGEPPEKPYSGKFNLRISPELHKQLTFEAARQGDSLNTYIVKILQARFSHSNYDLSKDYEKQWSVREE